MARSTAIARTATPEAQERVAFAEAALAVAGHQVTDPVVRDLMDQVAHDNMTGDQAIEALRRHIQR
ncbi:hypothetical protein [Arachnia rubra]|jgi:hypothetical protein|uniref:Antitoxin VbhA domain-containing protein n=1 Tax=Arachnia rubra TaxID=1547448 RepID=A0ABX7Y6L5_9ACTN|nr:hypothetical protein [Arachnia rubra]MDO4645472.1 hypothetical protein [Propionibacteriaceae bacterium]QUC08138.1 hypothetical protein J5A65_14755 [Arachnia rubra]BCR82510.1 hypothetical protein SK1NUM_29530 [Arachnia rubra]